MPSRRDCLKSSTAFSGNGIPLFMAARKKRTEPKTKECFFCKKRLSPQAFKIHDCWSTTETALTRDLDPDLKEAWEKLRDAAWHFGGQRSYASHRSIMFSRKACYFFVRPLKNRLELCFFVGRKIKHALIRKSHPTSKSKFAHLVFVTHGDQVESPLLDWLKEAYDFCPPQKEEGRKNAKEGSPSERKVVTFEELNSNFHK